jgi:hypothetical protein
MTIITRHNAQEYVCYGIHDKLGTPCSMCAEPLQYPFLAWRDTNDLYFCVNCCCGNLQSGFAADLVEIKAIIKMRELGYADVTVSRGCVSLPTTITKLTSG